MTILRKNVILGVTASIAAFRACDIIQGLKAEDFNVTVVMTADAKQFITPLTLGVLSQNKVYSEMFDELSVWNIEHISLAEKADLILIAPATADIISKFAVGSADNLLSCTVLASKAPILIAPAMNSNMYEHKVTQDNITKLKSWGYKFINPKAGKLACGKVGIGCLAEVEMIIKEVKGVIGDVAKR